jgi:hypothetical protein
VLFSFLSLTIIITTTTAIIIVIIPHRLISFARDLPPLFPTSQNGHSLLQESANCNSLKHSSLFKNKTNNTVQTQSIKTSVGKQCNHFGSIIKLNKCSDFSLQKLPLADNIEFFHDENTHTHINEGRLKNSWTRLITPSRNFVEV